MSTAQKSNLSTELDGFILDKDKAFWFAVLSDGQTVYQDDERYGEEDRAWLRLKAYCEENNVFVKEIYIRFRSHTERIIENNGDGVFHRRGALGSLVAGTKQFYLFGIVKGNTIEVQHWRIPEVIREEEDVRDIKNCEETIIWNQRNMSPDLPAKKRKRASS